MMLSRMNANPSKDDLAKVNATKKEFSLHFKLLTVTNP